MGFVLGGLIFLLIKVITESIVVALGLGVIAKISIMLVLSHVLLFVFYKLVRYI